MSVIALAIQSEGLTLREVVNGIPHDGPAILVYAMLAAFIGFIWVGSRKKSS